jgi:TRAP-type uncharacterized transport system substrate-binding protein
MFVYGREKAMRTFLSVSAIMLAVMAAVIGVAYFALRPGEFTVAIPKSDVLNHKVFGLAADTLRSQRASVRVEIVHVEDGKAALDALESGQVKLAVVRSDAAMQGRAQTVLIMRREVAVLVASKAGKLHKITDLPNATIGVTRDGPLDGSLLWPVLDYYGMPRDKAKYVALGPDDIADAFRLKKVDGLIAVGPITSKQMTDAIADAARGVKGAITFIDIEEADAIVKRLPALESVEVEQGAFGGRPPRPSESVNTLGFSIRLVATQKSEGDQIAELVRQLYLLRQNLNAAVPGAGLMETPDTEEATPFLIHPGVRAYVNGEQKNLFDRYSDYLYLLAFLGSGIGSIAAGMFGMARKREMPQVPINQLEVLLDTVRQAPSAQALDEVEREADKLFRSVFELGAADKLSQAAIASFSMAMNDLRTRIAAQRAALAH